MLSAITVGTTFFSTRMASPIIQTIPTNMIAAIATATTHEDYRYLAISFWTTARLMLLLDIVIISRRIVAALTLLLRMVHK